jgi:hypothetical protein
MVGHDGDELPSLSTGIIEEIDVVGPRGEVGKIDRKVLPPHGVSFELARKTLIALNFWQRKPAAAVMRPPMPPL